MLCDISLYIHVYSNVSVTCMFVYVHVYLYTCTYICCVYMYLHPRVVVCMSLVRSLCVVLIMDMFVQVSEVIGPLPPRCVGVGARERERERHLEVHTFVLVIDSCGVASIHPYYTVCVYRVWHNNNVLISEYK